MSPCQGFENQVLIISLSFDILETREVIINTYSFSEAKYHQTYQGIELNKMERLDNLDDSDEQRRKQRLICKDRSDHHQ